MSARKPPAVVKNPAATKYEGVPAPAAAASNGVALWSACAAFFGSLLAIGVIDVFNPDDLVKFATSLIVAAITFGAVYSKERLDAAKKAKGPG